MKEEFSNLAISFRIIKYGTQNITLKTLHSAPCCIAYKYRKHILRTKYFIMTGIVLFESWNHLIHNLHIHSRQSL